MYFGICFEDNFLFLPHVHSCTSNIQRNSALSSQPNEYQSHGNVKIWYVLPPNSISVCIYCNSDERVSSEASCKPVFGLDPRLGVTIQYITKHGLTWHILHTSSSFHVLSLCCPTPRLSWSVQEYYTSLGLLGRLRKFRKGSWRWRELFTAARITRGTMLALFCSALDASKPLGEAALLAKLTKSVKVLHPAERCAFVSNVWSYK